MIIYHSAFSLSEKYVDFLCGRKVHILRSFYTDRKYILPEYCSGLFLDSGAFSAFRSGAVIVLDEYIRYLGEFGYHFDAYAALDVIGDPIQTKSNQGVMDRAGLTAVPTFHVGEPWEYLDYYLDTHSYIALGGMVPYSGSQELKTWLRGCWKRILKATKQAKVHGFGLTDLRLMKCFPWWSVDSTTAARAGRTGVLVSPWGQIRVSEAIKKLTGASVCTKRTRQRVMDWLDHSFPGLVSSWDQVGGGSVEASQRRIAINALFIESESTKEAPPPVSSCEGFGLGG